MNEESLLGGCLESTNEPHAIARIAGIKMCEACNRQYGTRFMAVMPANLYGPNDNFGLETSHMLAATTWNDEAENQVYNVAFGERASLSEFFGLIKERGVDSDATARKPVAHIP